MMKKYNFTNGGDRILIKYFPFGADFKDAMLNGIKTMTSRNKKYGGKGDTFEIFGETFTLLEVFQQSLESIKNNNYKEEGFEKPKEFEDIWVKLHPRKGWIPEQMVYVHRFQKGVIKMGQQTLGGER